MNKDECPQIRLHPRDEPEDYFQWHAWARKKAKTHKQEKCPGCGLWAVWVPKTAGA